MRFAVESLPQPVRAGYYPGKFTEKMERRGLTLTGGGQTYLQIPVQRQEGRRGNVLRSWTPWPSWTIRYNICTTQHVTIYYILTVLIV